MVRYIRINKRRKQRELEQLQLNYVRVLADYGKKEEELRLLVSDSEQLRIVREREFEELKDIVLGYKEKLMTVNSHYSELNDRRLSDIVKSFHQKASGSRKTSIPTEWDWKELLWAFRTNLPAEQLVVCAEGVLATNERRACILLILGFTNSEIACLMEFTPQRVTNIKSRINRKLFHDSSASTLQANLKYLASKS